jgi:hypothetical protein
MGKEESSIPKDTELQCGGGGGNSGRGDGGNDGVKVAATERHRAMEADANRRWRRLLDRRRRRTVGEDNRAV